ncbi:YdcF family protein [Salibacterium lacus]|uniref:YdcF family protein n=1 Tax=Salibacterium lacus TaxID=1898109 RepID=A0ABW5T5B7_9BACI
MKLFLRVCLLSRALLLIYAVWTACSIWSFSQVTETKKTDAAIVLGAAVHGSEPSPVFQKRIDHAVQLWENDQVDALLFTGGRAEGRETAEAEAAAAYAVENGVEEESIYMETRSRITEENLKYAKKEAAGHQFNTFTLVSDPLHMKRAEAIAEDLGMDVISSPASDSAYQTWKTKIPFFLREWFFYTGYQLLAPFRF